MAIFKKVLLAVFVSVAMIATAPVTIAAGKIEKATPQEVTEAIKDTISLSEETLAAVESGAEKEAVLDLFKRTKQSSKRIESNIVDRLRQTANSRLKKARSAFKKDDKETAVAFMTEAIQIFKDVQKKHAAF
jgi:hypothetical protein